MIQIMKKDDFDWLGCVHFSGGVCCGPPDAGEVGDNFCNRCLSRCGFDAAVGMQAALAEKDKRIAELEAERDRAQEQVDFFRLEFNKYSERCSGLISVRDKLTAERDRLREAGENLRDYLNKGTWRDFDIPDEIWGPFEKSLDGPDWIAQAALRGEER